jgi:arginase family enzyme
VFGFGFGGAKVLDLAELPGVAHPGEVAFFGLDTELNRKFGRANPGAAGFVRKHTACMAPWTQVHGAPCHDVGLISSDDPKDAIHDAFELSEFLAGRGLRPVAIGCDHTASMVNALGTLQAAGQPAVYLYFDAHLDLGLHHSTLDLHNGNFVNFLLQAEQVLQVINVGARSWVSHAPVYRQVSGFTCVPGGLPRWQPGEVTERLALLREFPLYVSLDADVLDPSCAPEVSCPEPFGMSPEALFTICEWVGKSFQVVGADLCELVPSERSLGAEQVLMRCLHALFPKNI